MVFCNRKLTRWKAALDYYLKPHTTRSSRCTLTVRCVRFRANKFLPNIKLCFGYYIDNSLYLCYSLLLVEYTDTYLHLLIPFCLLLSGAASGSSASSSVGGEPGVLVPVPAIELVGVAAPDIYIFFLLQFKTFKFHPTPPTSRWPEFS